jgi:cell division initiation protein
MGLSGHDMREKRFKVRFRGFDVQEVDDFLHAAADSLEAMQDEIANLKGQLAAQERRIRELMERETSLKTSSSQAKAIALEIRKKAEKEAELIISKAEVTAEKILNNAHTRLAQLHEDLAELKRQRTHFEVKLRSFIEAHLKFLDMEKESNRDLDELEEKVRFMKRT